MLKNLWHRIRHGHWPTEMHVGAWGQKQDHVFCEDCLRAKWGLPVEGREYRSLSPTQKIPYTAPVKHAPGRFVLYPPGVKPAPPEPYFRTQIIRGDD